MSVLSKELDFLLHSVSDDCSSSFSAAVGNPPYQVESGNQKTHIWQYFVMNGTDYSIRSSFVHPSGWIKDGKRMSDVKNKWKEEKKLNVVHLFEFDLFPNALIKALTITFFDSSIFFYDETELFVYKRDGSIMKTVLDFNRQVYYLSDDSLKADSIIAKFRPSCVEHSMASIVQPQRVFGITGTYFRRASSDKYSLVEDAEHGLSTKVLAYEKLAGCDKKELYFYIDASDPYWRVRGWDYVDKWKVAFPEAGDKQGKHNHIVEPGVLVSDKFLVVVFDSKVEAVNFQRYLCSSFYSFGMAPLLVSQHALRKTHRNIPLLDFGSGEFVGTPGKCLDFASGVLLDEQFAEIFGLSVDELNFVRIGITSVNLWK